MVLVSIINISNKMELKEQEAKKAKQQKSDHRCIVEHSKRQDQLYIIDMLLQKLKKSS